MSEPWCGIEGEVYPEGTPVGVGDYPRLWFTVDPDWQAFAVSNDVGGGCLRVSVVMGAESLAALGDVIARHLAKRPPADG